MPIPKARCRKVQFALTVPTLEDKLLQRAVVMLLEPIYEQVFLDCSYGFRPGRSAHQALQSFRDQTMTGRSKGGWVYEVDIRKFLDMASWYSLQQPRFEILPATSCLNFLNASGLSGNR